jgi:hypothetical protein
MSVNNVRQNELRKYIANEPIFEATLCQGAFEQIDLSTPGGSIFYGTGITTQDTISAGLPFDILGMMLAAEKIRRIGSFDTVYHHIADSHATANEHVTQDSANAVSLDLQNKLERIKNNLDLNAFVIVRGSTIEDEPEYSKLLNKNIINQYVRREVADIEWYRKNCGVKVKLGWVAQAKNKDDEDVGFDEKIYDQTYIQEYPSSQLVFLYTKPGRTFDLSRPKASPYITTDCDHRLMLVEGEDVELKIIKAVEKAKGDKQLGGALKHIGRIVNLFETTVKNLGRTMPIEQKIQTIIDISTA